MLLTFRDGKHALEAIKYNNYEVRTVIFATWTFVVETKKLQKCVSSDSTFHILCQIGGKELLVGLRTPDWREQIEKEMSLVRSNTGMLFNTFTNSLLGEDFSIPTMSFDGK